jgi:organic radical activating enzyme
MNKYINIDRIEFIVTWRCNSNCKHCSVRHKRDSSPAAINAELTARIIKDITADYSPNSIMTFGGEPLLYPDVVYAIHSTAKTCGINSRQIITNAGYTRSEKMSHSIATKLAESGVNSIAVSVDAFHQEYIPVRIVEQNVKALIDVGISLCWDPCWVVSREHKNLWNERTRAILNELDYFQVRENDGNNFHPNRNAAEWLSDYMPDRIQSPQGSCKDVPYGSTLDKKTSISVVPDGDIMVCNDFSIGNAGQQNMSAILQNYDPYKIPEMEAILNGGLVKLVEFTSERGIEPAPEGYFSICDECVDLRRRLAEYSV